MSYELIAFITHETENAIRVKDEATGELLWIPCSQVEEIHRTKPARIIITDWIARKKGLI